MVYLLKGDFSPAALYAAWACAPKGRSPYASPLSTAGPVGPVGSSLGFKEVAHRIIQVRRSISLRFKIRFWGQTEGACMNWKTSP